MGAPATPSGSRPSDRTPSGSAAPRVDPSRRLNPNVSVKALHPDIHLMLLASPTDSLSALMPTGLSARELNFAMNSGAYREVYRPARKEFGYQLTDLGRRLRAEAALLAQNGGAA